MTRKEWLSAVDKIDDKYINELADHQLKKKQKSKKKTSEEAEVVLKPQYFRADSSLKSGAPCQKVMIAAAAVVCVVAVGIFIRINNKPQVVPPNDSTGASSGNTISGTSGLPVPENLILDLNLPENTPSAAPVIKLKPRFWDNDKLREIFIRDKEITSETNYESNGFADEKRYVVYFGDNMRLIYEPTNISCERNDDISAVQSSIASLIEGRWLEQFSDEELKSFPKADALARVQNIIDKLEITNLGEPVIRSVSAEKGNELMSGRTSADKDGNEHTRPEMTDADEFYFITYPLVYNDIELSQHLKMNADFKKSHRPSYIKAVVAKNGIAEFKCENIYESEFEAQENVLINCGAQDALNALIKHYNETFQMSYTTLSGCKLVYITEENLDGQSRVLIPIWQFSGYEITEAEKEQGLKPERLHYDYVLPQTGEIYEELF